MRNKHAKLKASVGLVNLRLILVDDFTIVADIELYCHKSWARIVIQSIFPLGSFVGLMVMNLVSDTRGRRQAFLIALGIAFLSTCRKKLIYF